MPDPNAERERLVRDLQDARNTFEYEKSQYDYHIKQAEYLRENMEIAQILGLIRAEALRAFDIQQEEG